VAKTQAVLVLHAEQLIEIGLRVLVDAVADVHLDIQVGLLGPLELVAEDHRG
jgi:hypothetical protein